MSNMWNTNSCRDIKAEGNASVHIGNSHYTTIHNYAANPDAVEQDTGKRRIDFLNKLSTVDYAEQKDRNPKRVEGTCKWFTTHRLFEEWKEKKASALLWVSADPGCGKSVLTRHLIDNNLASDPSPLSLKNNLSPEPPRIICYFFFKEEFEKQNSMEGAICSVLYQLFTQLPTLLSDDILGLFEKEENAFYSSFFKLWHTFTRAAGRHHKSDIICILDALDECAGYEVLVKALVEYHTQDNGPSRLKFLVTSRPYREIQEKLQSLKSSQRMVHLSGEAEEHTIAKEIAIVIKHGIENLEKERQFSPQEKQILEDELTAVTHRTYLWVHLIFVVLKGVNALNHDDWRTSVRTLPRTVEEAYSRILSKTTDPEKTRKILQIIVAAERPLKLAEIAEILAFCVKKHTSYEEIQQNTHTQERIQAEIRQACGLFIVVQNGEIFLLHQTAKEFLVCMSPMQPMTHSPLSWKDSIDLKASHSLLAEICIRYLLLFNRQKWYQAKRVHQSHNPARFFFLDYATNNWTTHYREVQTTINMDLEELALKLCGVYNQKYQQWLNACAKPGGFYLFGLPSSILVAAYFGLQRLVDRILDKTPNSLSSCTQDGRTALSLASEEGYDLVIQSLLDRIAKAKVVWKDKLFLSRSRTIVNKIDRYKRSPLWYAATHGHQKIVEQLLQKGANVDTKDDAGLTPLFWAGAYGHTEILNRLIAGGAQQGKKTFHLETRDSFGTTALIRAVETGDKRPVQRLLDYGADPNTSSHGGRTALLYASANGYYDIAKLLLDRGADIYNIQRAFLEASLRNHKKVAKLLLDSGADVNACDKKGNTALLYASREGANAVAKMLLDCGANVGFSSINGNTALMMACIGRSDNIDEMSPSRSPYYSAAPERHETALIRARKSQYCSLASLLLQNGADVNVSNRFGDTALSLALRYRQDDMANLFREKGAKEPGEAS